MGFNSHALAGKSLLASALLLSLAACGDAAAPVEEETPAAETVVATPAPVASEPVAELAAEPTNETPSAASGLQPATTRTPAPSARKTAPAPVPADRKSVVYGTSVSVRVDLGGRRNLNKKNKHSTTHRPPPSNINYE